MIQNILTYVFTDIFYQLWMSAAYPGISRHKIPSYNRNHWPPEFVKHFDGETPSVIDVFGEFHHINNDGEFHLGRNSPSLGFDEMRIVWGDEVVAESFPGKKIWSVRNMHREGAPAQIILTDVKKWHHKGDLHRRRGDALICKQAKFLWVKNNAYTRENGPYEVVLKNISVKSTKGQVDDVHYLSKSFSWATHNKTKIPSRIANAIIDRCKLKVDLLATDSIFSGDEDEFIFLSELGD